MSQDAQKNWFARHKVLTGFLVLFVIGLIGSASGKGVSEKSENTNPPSASSPSATAGSPTEAPTKAPEPSAIKISASQLYSEYEANEIAADATYKGKVLEVSGKIDSIAKDILDHPYITLKTQAVFGSIQCVLKESEEGKAATLKTGTALTMRGIGNGKLGNVLLKDCEVVQE